MTGTEIKRIRVRLGLTQQQLADRIGTTKNTVYRWEKEMMAVREPTAKLIRLLAHLEQVRRKAK